MGNLKFEDPEIQDMTIFEMQAIDGGSKISYLAGYVARKIYDFASTNSDREVQMRETLMNCI